MVGGVVRGAIATVRYFAGHPLAKQQPVATLKRWLRWQVGARLVPGAVAVPFVGGARLVVSRGMTGATGNVYLGLHEWADMLFLLHVLREGDLFLDMGANVGSYTVLAAAVRRARCVSVEPVAFTHDRLLTNVRVNDLGSLVRAPRVGLAGEPGTLWFTTGLDTRNHVIESDVAGEGIAVPVTTVDSLLEGEVPTLFKLDVEGYEENVLRGGEHTFRDPRCLAGIVEMTTAHAARIDERLRAYGFRPHRYDPQQRRIFALDSWRTDTSNTVYIKDTAAIAERVAGSPLIDVLGLAI